MKTLRDLVPWTAGRYEGKHHALYTEFPGCGPDVLDIGGNRTHVSYHLARAGYRVVCIDPTPPDFEPDVDVGAFTYIQDDFVSHQFGKRFDTVLDICAIHHFGKGFYGDPLHGDRSDIAAFTKVATLLKPGGRFFVVETVRKDFWEDEHHRFYDRAEMARALEPFIVTRTSFYYRFERIDEDAAYDVAAHGDWAWIYVEARLPGVRERWLSGVRGLGSLLQRWRRP